MQTWSVFIIKLVIQLTFSQHQDVYSDLAIEITLLFSESEFPPEVMPLFFNSNFRSPLSLCGCDNLQTPTITLPIPITVSILNTQCRRPRCGFDATVERHFLPAVSACCHGNK